MTTIPELIRIYIKGFKQLFLPKRSRRRERKTFTVKNHLIFLISLSLSFCLYAVH